MTPVRLHHTVAGLEKWYQVFLLAFPKHYRQIRGTEMLATLLDAASPGQARPSLREAVSVITAGLRCRLRLRRGRALKVAALSSTLAGAILAGITGAWLAWSTGAPPLPDEYQAAAIARTAVAQDPIHLQRFDFLFGSNGYDYTSGSVEFDYASAAAGGPSPLLAEARGRLLSAGWSMAELEFTQTNAPQGGYPSATRLIGHKGDIHIAMNDSHGEAHLRLARIEPSSVPILTIVSALIGGLCGWLLTARISRRTAQQHPIVRKTTTILASATLVALFPACSYAVLLYTLDYTHGPPWLALAWPPLTVLTGVGIVIGALTISLSEFPIVRSESSL